MKALRFEGSGFEYFKIWIVNVLLTIVTIGLYYPWAKVRNHRYFYANSTLEGRNFEYHATGKQLFIGYLIAMGILIVFTVIQSVSPFGILLFMLTSFLAFPWIIWRSLKFNLRMSSFSNVRFSFEGLLGGAYFNFMLMPLLFFISLYVIPISLVFILPKLGMSNLIGVFLFLGGIATLALAIYLFALMRKRNTCYAIDGYRYGQGKFSCNLETKVFVLILLKTLGLGIAVMILGIILMAIFISASIGLAGLTQIQESMSDPGNMEDAMSSIVAIIFPVYAGMILAFLFIGAYSFTRQRTYIFSNSSLDEKITFVSTLKAKSMAWVMISNLIVIVFTLGLATPWAKVRMARLLLENTLVDTDAGFDEYLSEKQEQQSSLGEQIGDAFDVDVGIGI